MVSFIKAFPVGSQNNLAKQLTFELPVKPALGRDAFFVSDANKLAVRRLEDWRDWPNGRLVLVGPKGAGKTHLADVWARETGAQIVSGIDVQEAAAPSLAEKPFLVVEDADQVAGDAALEEALFHVYNLRAARNGALMLTARLAPSRWGVKLPDLASRLGSLDIVRIDAPDDSLLAALLVKLFADRQLDVAPDLVPFLLRRMERSAAAAVALVDLLDQAALQSGKGLTKRLAASVLDTVPDNGL